MDLIFLSFEEDFLLDLDFSTFSDPGTDGSRGDAGSSMAGTREGFKTKKIRKNKANFKSPSYQKPLNIGRENG